MCQLLVELTNPLSPTKPTNTGRPVVVMVTVKSVTSTKEVLEVLNALEVKLSATPPAATVVPVALVRLLAIELAPVEVIA